METRAKDLKDLTMWNCTNPGIEFLDLSDAFFSKSLFFCRNLATSPSQINGERFSKLNDKFTMSLFDNEKGQDLLTQIKKSMPCNDPFIAVPFKELISSFFKGCRTGARKSFLEPMKKSYISIRNLKNTPIVAVFVAIIGFIFKFAGVKTSFSIDYTCEVGEVDWVVNFRNVFNPVFMVNVIERHDISNVTGSLTSIHLTCI